MPIMFQKETGALEVSRLQFAELEPLRFTSHLCVAYILGVEGKIIKNMQHNGGRNVTKGGRKKNPTKEKKMPTFLNVGKSKCLILFHEVQRFEQITNDKT
jgi:hypothetical protein